MKTVPLRPCARSVPSPRAGFRAAAYRFVLPLACAVWLAPCGLCGQEAAAEEVESPKPAESTNGVPPAPADPAAAEIARAVLKAKKDLETAQSQTDKEAKELQAKIVEGTKAILALRDEEKSLTEKLAAVEKERKELDDKLSAADETRRRATESMAAVRLEIESQASGLKERLAGSLATAQDEQIFQAAADLRSSDRQALNEQLKVLLEVYDRVLQYARTAALFQIPVRIRAPGADRIEPLKVLRLGFLGGCFTRAGLGGSKGGFVVPDPERKTGFLAVDEGLTERRKDAIALFLQKPEKGGILPLDVSGGTAIAALGTRETLKTWFRHGGIWMWPLLAMAAIALYASLERTFILLLRNLAAGREAKRLAGLVRSGRAEVALAECARRADSIGNVFGAALGHRERGNDGAEVAVQEALVRAGHFVRSRLGLIALFAGLAPLIGFVGTVAGLIEAFKMTAVWGQSLPSLSGGLSQALVATQAGLLIAVPCFLVAGFLRSLGDRILCKLEAGALAIMVAVLESQSAEAPLELGAKS